LGEDSLAKHDFGIIDFFEEGKWYSNYEPEKYNCISIDDDLLEQIIIEYRNDFINMNTYFIGSTQPGNGLDYCGVTLIPPESLEQFIDIIIKANKQFKARDLELLLEKIAEAIKANKYLIHYGI